MRTMRFIELFSEVECKEMLGPSDVEVTGISYRSQDVQEGNVFVAIPGTKTDGHRFIPQALSQGARALIVKNPPNPLPAGIAAAVVEDPRRAMAFASARFYDDPSGKIELFGITGTNGKTTTTYLLESILQAAGKNPAVIGTVNYRLRDFVQNAAVTTPESVDIQRLLSAMIERGADCAVMEVSSHALDQGRVYGLKFAVRAFSNLSRDHLDYHGDMESYWMAKEKFFIAPEFENSGRIAVNVDDPYGVRLIDKIPQKIVPYGVETQLPTAVRVLGWRMNGDGIYARIVSRNNEYEIHSKLVGRTNLYNILCAITMAEIAGVEKGAIVAGIEKLTVAPGRLEKVPNDKGVLVVVDYSHTPDALEKAIITLKEITSGRLFVVFGCGGDRDRGKRPIMGKIATSMANATVITSDNPRSEKPMAIIEEILSGVEGKRVSFPPSEFDRHSHIYWVEPDRRSAIFQAVESAREGDAVLIAGKGHENYQILGDVRIHFDDREVAEEALKVKA